jgi:gamma-glutamyltranspeptidase/glutathione hydrolase
VPPPFSAFQMLETLNLLEGYDLRAWSHNSADYLHHLVEAVKLASADRLAYAYSGEVPIGGLLSKRYAESQRARIDPKRAGVSEGERHRGERLPDQIAEGLRPASPTSRPRTSPAPTPPAWSCR